MTPCLTNAYNALVNRHLAPPTSPIEGFSFINLQTQIGTLRLYFVDHLLSENEAWRVGKGKSKLTKVDASIAEDNITFHKVKLMIKREVYTQDATDVAQVTKARGIQFTVNEASAYSYAPEYYAFSKALAQLSHEPYTLGGITFVMVYSAKMNHADIGEFATTSEEMRSAYVNVYIDERDGKNWDANVQVPHREALCQIYDQLDNKLAAHARSGIAVSGSLRTKDGGRVRYKVRGTVKSGHPDTSSGNGCTNREVSIQAIAGLPEHLRPKLVRALIMGDDYLAWLYFDHPVSASALKAALDHNERALGIHPKRGLFLDVRCASFISLGFYRAIDGSIVALPKVGRLFSRLFWTVTPLEGRDPRRLASGIAASFYPLYSTWRPMRTFLKMHMQVPPLDVTGHDHYYCWSEVGLHRLPAPIHWTENHLVKYGLRVACFDHSFEGPQCAGLVEHPCISEMLETDCADPADRRGCIA